MFWRFPEPVCLGIFSEDRRVVKQKNCPITDRIVIANRALRAASAEKTHALETRTPELSRDPERLVAPPRSSRVSVPILSVGISTGNLYKKYLQKIFATEISLTNRTERNFSRMAHFL